MAQPIKERVLAGRYRVLERLGSGGMAAVYLAEDERLGRRVAVKRLHADGPEDMARRFRREAKLLASLNHPNVVGVFDTVTDPEGVLIVMEYVGGETLSQALARGPLDPARAREVVSAVAAALDHAHEHGVLHRDVKPANVLLGDGGTVKLADLGIATAAEGTQITRTGTVLGTPAYMAPEQIEGKPLTPAVDVYALAAVAFEALAGRKAREGRTPMEIAHRVATEPPPDLRDAWPKAPPAAADVLRRGMARDPRRRPSSAGELAAELDAALAEGVTASTAPLAQPGRTASLPAAAAAPARAVAARRTPPPPGSAAAAPARPRRRRSLGAWLPLAALLAVVGAIVAFAAADDGNEAPSGDEAALPAQAEEPGGDQPREQQSPPEGEQAPDQGQEQGDPVARGIELNDQGFALMNDGRFGDAIPLLQESVGLLDGSGRIEYQYALFNLGSALRQAGRPEEAIPILEQRLTYPDQRDTVQRELDLAREAAGQDGRAEGRGNGRGNRGKGDKDDD